ncbi:MAG TPA: hypothetical protein VJ602_10005 [Paludibacter sp.]|nr:hypothetical protein [Paludibacter sp.]
MIKKLLQENLPDAFSIIESVIRKMNAEKIEQWDEVYPNVEILEKDIKKGEAYGFFDSTELKGFIVLNEEYSAEYDSLEWEACCGKVSIPNKPYVECKKSGLRVNIVL